MKITTESPKEKIFDQNSLIREWIDYRLTIGFSITPDLLDDIRKALKISRTDLLRSVKAYLKEKGIDHEINYFSYYKKPIYNTQPYEAVRIFEIYELIKSDRFKRSTELLRVITDKKAASKFKASNFDYVTFGGVFDKRHEDNLNFYSGLICLDFDHVQDITSVKKLLSEDPLTELLFTSPSGDGLKWIVSVNTEKYSYQDLFKGLRGYVKKNYNLEIDPSGADVSRACFLPYDKDIFINPKYLSYGV